MDSDQQENAGEKTSDATPLGKTDPKEDEWKEHAKRMFKFLEGGMVEITASYPAGVIGTTLENLQAAAAGEHEEWSLDYPKFADKAVRKDVEHLDEGLDSKTYFEAVNVDPPSHYFKNELVIPWLRKVLK